MITCVSKIYSFVAYLMNYSFSFGSIDIKIWYIFAFNVVLNIILKMILPNWTGGISAFKINNNHFNKSRSDINKVTPNSVKTISESGTFVVYKDSASAHNGR